MTSVLALAHVMNLSGQAAGIGHFVAGAGAGPTLLSPVLDWFGVAVSGSDTSVNALFGALRVTAARESGRKVLPRSVGLLPVMCPIVVGQSSAVLDRMPP